MERKKRNPEKRLFFSLFQIRFPLKKFSIFLLIRFFWEKKTRTGNLFVITEWIRFLLFSSFQTEIRVERTYCSLSSFFLSFSSFFIALPLSSSSSSSSKLKRERIVFVSQSIKWRKGATLTSNRSSTFSKNLFTQVHQPLFSSFFPLSLFFLLSLPSYLKDVLLPHFPIIVSCGGRNYLSKRYHHPSVWLNTQKNHEKCFQIFFSFFSLSPFFLFFSFLDEEKIEKRGKALKSWTRKSFSKNFFVIDTGEEERKRREKKERKRREKGERSQLESRRQQLNIELIFSIGKLNESQVGNRQSNPASNRVDSGSLFSFFLSLSFRKFFSPSSWLPFTTQQQFRVLPGTKKLFGENNQQP